MKHAIFFAGSGQKVSEEQYVYKDWAERLEPSGYKTILLDGVGVNTSKVNQLTGAGWATIIQEAMNQVAADLHGAPPEKVIVVGMSRGGVEAVICSHCLMHEYRDTPVFVFAIDPVQGYHAINSGAFDMSSTRNPLRLLGKKGSRDGLKARYSLENDAPKTIPSNVAMYLSVLSQFRGKQRGLAWGFTPQSPTLHNMIDKSKRRKVYELLGDHSSGVYSGNASEGAVKTSREARSLVTRDMFFHWLLQTGFASVKQENPYSVLDAYCKIANDDLREVQFDERSSGFSFLRTSQNQPHQVVQFDAQRPNHSFLRTSQNQPRQFTGIAMSRKLKGREHLIASQQVAESKKHRPELRGYYVNERHFEVYCGIRNLIDITIKTDPKSLGKLCPNIPPWLVHNEKGGFS